MNYIYGGIIGLTLAALLALAWVMGEAADRNRVTIDQSPIETGQRARCAATYEIAAQIMRTRQAGAPLAEALAVTDDEAMQDMVSEAWRQPRVETKDAKDAMVDFFATARYDDCLGDAR